MDNPYKLNVKLMQYSPLLHFQGETVGACLRASEVKPKLDRFLWDYLDRCGIVPPESWQLRVDEEGHGGYKPALRYKMRFAGLMEKVDAHLLYFAQNMGGKAVAMMGKMPIEMTIISLCAERLTSDVAVFGNVVLHEPTLLQVIEKMLPAFFALHCFGARSGKGFGSFEVDGNRVSDQEIDFYKETKCLKIYRLKSRARDYDYKKCQNDIYVLSGMMKGGFNSPYHKGEIQTELLPQYSSEKAFIKQEVFPNEMHSTHETLAQWYDRAVCHGDDHTRATANDYRFVRAMLGLADHYSYGVGRSAESIKVSAQDSEIKRFANPVRFKPCKDGFRVVVWHIPEKLMGATFNFAYAATPHLIKTPSVGEFDLVQFVDDFLSPLYDGNKWNLHRWDDLYDWKCYLFYGKDNPRNEHIPFSDTLDQLSVVFGR